MIKYVDHFVPNGRIPIEQIFLDAKENGKLPSVFNSAEEGIGYFRNKLGLQMVSHSQGLTEEEMLANLLSQFINAGIIDKKDIDLIISIGDNYGNSERMPNISHYLQNLYGFLNADVLIFSGNQCANTEYAVLFSEAMLKAQAFTNIVIINANIYRKNADRIVGTYGIHGDGAGIIYLNSDEYGGIEVIGGHSYTNGILYNANFKNVSSLELYKNYMTCLLGFIQKFKIRPLDISSIIIQNANYLLINHCLQNLGFDTKLLYLENINKYGHLDSIDFIVNLNSFNRQFLNTDMSFFSFGVGTAGSHCCLYMQKR
jgi:3-oxoacyl-[acyl-carrier-protein] synthase III